MCLRQVYCFYEGSRDVAPGYKKSAFDSRPFGIHMDVAKLMEKQVRIERQDKAHVTTASFDKFAAHAFQVYIQSALAFSIKRCGILYGRFDDDQVVYIDAIYEPEQQGMAESLSFDCGDAQVRLSSFVHSFLATYLRHSIFCTGILLKFSLIPAPCEETEP
jgi:nuclear protein localization protein 4 homolog